MVSGLVPARGSVGGTDKQRGEPVLCSKFSVFCEKIPRLSTPLAQVQQLVHHRAGVALRRRQLDQRGHVLLPGTRARLPLNTMSSFGISFHDTFLFDSARTVWRKSVSQLGRFALSS